MNSIRTRLLVTLLVVVLASAAAAAAVTYHNVLAEAESLMARGIFRAAMHDAQRALGEEPTQTGEAAGMALVRMNR